MVFEQRISRLALRVSCRLGMRIELTLCGDSGVLTEDLSVANTRKWGTIMLTARDIMTDNVMTIGPNATVQEAIEILLQHRISGLPVVDANDKLIGIVTEFALLAVAYDEEVRQEKVLKHMTTELITVAPEDPIRKVADLCIMHRVRRVPVIENGRLIGLIARCDVLKGIYEVTKRACAV